MFVFSNRSILGELQGAYSRIVGANRQSMLNLNAALVQSQKSSTGLEDIYNN
jgi:hypothetical protein